MLSRQKTLTNAGLMMGQRRYGDQIIQYRYNS